MNNRNYMRRREPMARYGSCKENVCQYDIPCDKEPISDGYSSLAMVYSISQSWRMIDDSCEGFKRGTIFDELNKPFLGDKCKRGGCCK